MNSIFQHSSSHWVRYEEYELKEAEDGNLYVLPTSNAKPAVYDPLADADTLVLDALNVGMLLMKRTEDTDIQKAVMDFVTKYGLLGLMTALPTTPTFMDYEAVYLPKNKFIKEESLATEAYLKYFFPFDQPDIKKRGVESQWNITEDRTLMALAMTFSDKPTSVRICMQRAYAERYDWLLAQFKDWAFIFCTSIFYYQDNAKLDENTKGIYRQAMAALDGIAPSYHIELRDKPTIVWDFHSLLLGIQMMFSFALADEESTLKACRKCQRVFAASRLDEEFCNDQCKQQYRGNKSREGD